MSDLSITSAHRTCLRRIRDTGDPGDLGHLLPRLMEADLIAHRYTIQRGGAVYLTEAGRLLLEAHDALAETRRIERPRLQPLPLPPRWHLDDRGMLVHASGTYEMEYDDLDVEGLDVAIALVRDLVEVLDWLRHERAVAVEERELGPVDGPQEPYRQPPMTESEGTPQEVLAAHLRWQR